MGQVKKLVNAMSNAAQANPEAAARDPRVKTCMERLGAQPTPENWHTCVSAFQDMYKQTSNLRLPAGLDLGYDADSTDDVDQFDNPAGKDVVDDDGSIDHGAGGGASTNHGTSTKSRNVVIILCVVGGFVFLVCSAVAIRYHLDKRRKYREIPQQ